MLESYKLGEKTLRPRTDLHLLRKFWHAGTGLTGLFFYSYSELTPQQCVPFLLGFAFLSLTADILRIRSPKINKVVLFIMGAFMRDSEKDSISGMPFYALGVGLALAFYEEKIAILAILFLIFADPISSYVGIKYGKRKILPNKSLEGSLAGAGVCFALSYVYGIGYGQGGLELLVFALFAGFIGSLSEFLSQKIDDNLTIPFISGLGLSVLNGLFHIL